MSFYSDELKNDGLQLLFPDAEDDDIVKIELTSD